MGAREESEPRGAGLTTRSRAAIFFLALGLRLLALLELSGSPWNEVLLGDARYFDDWGLRIAGGDWRGEGVFYQAPLYPYLLGVLYALVGHVPWLVRILQCLLGSLAALWIAQGTSRFASRRASLAAGCLAACYGPSIWYELQIEKTAMACALTALLLCLVLAPDGRTTARRAFAAGLVLGALTLLRENAVVLLAPVLWVVAREGGARVRRILPLAAGFALLLGPVALHNRAQGGVFLPTASNAGVNFYIGNAAEADGLYRPLVAGRGHPDHEREDATRIAQDLSARELSPAAVSGFWFRLALSEIADEPAHFAWLAGRKLRLLGHHLEIMDAAAFEVFQDESFVLTALAFLSFGILLPLFLAGAVLAWGRPRAGPVLASVALLALSVLAFFVVGRFRLGLVPLALPFAGIALTELSTSGRRRPATGLLVAGALLAWWPIPSTGDPRATSAANLASELVRRGDAAGAERWARAARAQDPRSAEAAYNLGIALRMAGKETEAVEPFQAALELEPAYTSDCLAELGAIRARAGDAAGARELLQQALVREPEHAAARRYIQALERAQGSE